MIVWIDHKKARVCHFKSDDDEQRVVHAPHVTPHHKDAGKSDTGDNAFMRDVAQKIGAAGAVLVTGPASAKTELAKYIERHVPTLDSKIAGVENLDHPADRELVAFGRRYFHTDHQDSRTY